MNWYKWTIHTTTEAVEALAYQLEEVFGAKGVEIFDPKDLTMHEKGPTDWDYMDEKLEKQLQSDEVLVSAYFSEQQLNSPQKVEEMRFHLESVLKDIAKYLPVGRGQIDTQMMDENVWANNWKNFYHPFHIGKIFVIPSWIDEPVSAEDLVIRMDPGMAFGSGTHETTSMCVEFLQDVLQGSETVLDIGCGSGILGIAAAKLGAGKVYASDLDVSAIPVAEENTKRNHVDDVMEVHCGDLMQIEALRAVTPDVIVSNIIADVIIGFTPDVAKKLKKGGAFIASGIIRERESDVTKALTDSGFTIRDIHRKGSWVAIYAESLH